MGEDAQVGNGPSGRFATVGAFASSCRWVGSTTLSNGKRKGQGKVKNGHKDRAWAFVAAANFAVRSHAQINRFSGNVSRTAEFVGMERSALHRKLKTLGIA